MSTVAVSTRERSIMEFNTPGAVRLADVLQSVSLGDGGGAWVGPLPRVTRTAIIGDAFYTYVTWIWQFPGNVSTTAEADRRQRLRNAVTAKLRTISGDFDPVSIVDYQEAVNGSLDWWRTGQASITRTKERAATVMGRIDADENPAGPTTSDTHSTSFGEALGGAATSAVPILYGVAAVAGALGLGYIAVTFGPIVAQAVRPRRSLPEETKPKTA